jgi:anti-sigma factor RsiW
MTPLTCEVAGALIARAADGELGAAEQARLDGHLAGCVACRVELEGQRAVRTLLSRRGHAPLPDGFHARLDARLGRERGWFGLADWRWWTVRLSPAAAALLVLALVTSPPQAGALRAPPAAMDEGETPVYAVLWEPQVSDESLLRIVLAAHPDAALEDYLGDSADDR